MIAIRNKRRKISELCLFVILFCVIIFPLVSLLLNMDAKAFSYLFSRSYFWPSVGNSVLSALVSTVISIVIAYLLAWSINRTDIKGKAIWNVVLVLPMLIPSISHGTGLIMLFGNNGVIANLFHTTSSIYGFSGVVIGSVMYSFPVAFLMISDTLKYQDYAPYAAAKVLGIPPHRQFTGITAPYLKKPMISVLFAVFTMIITDYGVPLSVGGHFKTLPVILYEEAVGQLNYSVGSVVGLILLIPAVITFLFDLFNKDDSKSSTVSQEFVIEHKTRNSVIAYTTCIVVTLFTAMVFGVFYLQALTKHYPLDMRFSFDNFLKTFDKGGLEYLVNSLLISLFTAVVGVVVSFILAYLTAREKSRLAKVLHLMTITSLAIPGLVLGLSYVIVFKSTFFYGTIIILVMVNIVHFVASPYLMLYNAMGKINDNIEDVGSILGIPRMRIIGRVILPQCKFTILEAMSYFFVNSMMTISAVSFLAGLGNKPLALLINQFEAYSMVECAAVVAIMIFTVNFIVKCVVGIIKRRGEK